MVTNENFQVVRSSSLEPILMSSCRTVQNVDSKKFYHGILGFQSCEEVPCSVPRLSFPVLLRYLKC